MNNTSNIEYARMSLLGLSIGDAFGDSFFGDSGFYHTDNRIIPPETKWEFTDDTVMAIAVLNNLSENGTINQDRLAQQFADNYRLQPDRGYGGTAHSILREIGEGGDWHAVSSAVFDGQGSMGNGAAMRAAPLGAYFHDTPDRIIPEARKSAEVTHLNKEAVTGAVAVAAAASLALNLKLSGQEMSPEDFIGTIYHQLDDSDTRSKTGKAMHIPGSYRTDTVVSILGNGTRLLAQDTVPISLWFAAHYLDNYEEALWEAVSAAGDRDTICAIVGSIVILYAGIKTVPPAWIKSVEKIGNSMFE